MPATQDMRIQDMLLQDRRDNPQLAPGALQSREPGDPELRVSTDAPLGTTADTGIDLECRDYQTPDGEYLDSLIDEGPAIFPEPVKASINSIAVSPETLAAIGEQAVRQCVADALDSWPTDFMRHVETGNATRSHDPMNATMLMKVLHDAIRANLRTKDIDPSSVWPLVTHVIRNVFHRLVECIFAGQWQ